MPIDRFSRITLGSGLTGTDLGGGEIELAAAGGGGVDSIAKSGDTGLTGDVTLSEGSGVTLTQSGNDIEIAASGASAALTLLHTLTLGSAGTFDQSSISGGYNDLMLVLTARSSAAVLFDSAFFRFNNDSGSNYYFQVLRGNSTTASAIEGRGSSGVDRASVPGSSAPANSFGVVRITIHDYASSSILKAGTYESFAYVDSGAAGMRHETAGFLWNSTAAITRVQIVNGNAFGNFATGSELRIYGRT